MAVPFSTDPRQGEPRWLHGLRTVPLSILNQIAQPFQPGGRLDILHGGILDPNVPGSLGNAGWSIVGKPFGLENGQVAAADAQKGINYGSQPARTPTPTTKPQQVAQVQTPGGGKYPFIVPAGASVSSAFRTPEHNERVGGVKGSYHTRTDSQGRPLGLDIVPRKGESMAQLAARAAAENPHAQVIPESDHVHLEPKQGMQLGAFEQAARATGLGAAPPPFNGAGYQAADAMLEHAQGLQMKPFSGTYQPLELPPVPTPTMLQTPDTTAGDAAFEAATPKNPFGATPEEQEKGKLKVRRAEYFAGLAQAMMSVDTSKGLGEMFLKMGAGAIAGAAYGDKIVQEKTEKFDEAMQRYNLALAYREEGKAKDAANIANQNTAALNQHARDQWQVGVQQMQKFESRIENGVLITFQKNEDGTVTQTHTPLDETRQVGALIGRANNVIAATNARSEYDLMVYRHDQAIASAALPYALNDAIQQNNPQQAGQLFGIGLTEAADALVQTGRWEEVAGRTFGPQVVADTKAEAYRILGVQLDKKGQPVEALTEAQREAMNMYISSQLVTDFVNDNKAHVLMGGEVQRDTHDRQGNIVKSEYGGRRSPDPAVTSSVGVVREQRRRRSTRTDSKGRVTSTESY